MGVISGVICLAVVCAGVGSCMKRVWKAAVRAEMASSSPARALSKLSRVADRVAVAAFCIFCLAFRPPRLRPDFFVGDGDGGVGFAGPLPRASVGRLRSSRTTEVILESFPVTL
jgi:hypothetical protein